MHAMHGEISITAVGNASGLGPEAGAKLDGAAASRQLLAYCTN